MCVWTLEATIAGAGPGRRCNRSRCDMNNKRVRRIDRIAPNTLAYRL